MSTFVTSGYENMIAFNSLVLERFKDPQVICTNVHNATTIITLTQTLPSLSVSPEVFDTCDDIYANWQQQRTPVKDIENVKNALIHAVKGAIMTDEQFGNFLANFNSTISKLYTGLLEEID